MAPSPAISLIANDGFAMAAQNVGVEARIAGSVAELDPDLGPWRRSDPTSDDPPRKPHPLTPNLYEMSQPLQTIGRP